MAFDPDYPVPHSKIRSAEMRAQFNGLKELIDNVPAGPPGEKGDQGDPGEAGAAGAPGLPFANAVVDGVTTLAPGTPATVHVSFDGTLVHFTLGLPQGAVGPEGPQGPPLATVVIDGVTTLGAGEPASASVTFDGSLAHLSFAIPCGATGLMGPQGPQGVPGPPVGVVIDSVTTGSAGSSAVVEAMFDGTNVHFSYVIPRGDPGVPGPPGEVTAAQLSAAIAGTARSPAGIGPFTGTFSDPVTQGEMQAFAAYVETLRVGLLW